MNTPLTIGIAGHVDHGKTSLVMALTGIDTDRKAEEKRRGLSIESGVAQLNLADGQVALIDVPGHTDFLKNTIRGLSSVDLALLVVAADDGVMPQTREHLSLLEFFQVEKGLVVLTKTDLVDEEILELAEFEISETVQGTFLEDAPVIRFAAPGARGRDTLIKKIGGCIRTVTAKKTSGPFRMWVDHLRSFHGYGTVVSGTILSGSLTVADRVQIEPLNRVSRVRSLEAHGRKVEAGVAGQRVGINLAGVPLHALCRGMHLGAPDTIAPVYMLNADIRILKTAAVGVKNRQKVKLYLGTAVVSATLVLMSAKRLAPGESGFVQMRLRRPVAALPQDTFVICPLNLNTVIAGGRVLEIPREKYRAVKEKTVLPLLKSLRAKDVAAYAEALFATSRKRLVTARALATATGLSHGDFESLINAKVQKKELVYFKGRGAVKTSHLEAMKRTLKKAMTDAFRADPLKKNINLAEAGEYLGPGLSEALLEAVTEQLCREKAICPFEGGFILARPEKALDADREELMALLLDFAKTSGLNPFSADTFWKLHQPRYEKPDIRQVLDFLFSRKKLVRLNDKRFLSLDAIERIKTRVKAAIAEKGFITISDCKAVLGYGRWGGIPVLDYLDRIGFTVRREDKRTLREDCRP